MSWREPTLFEQDLLADARVRWPEILPLARHLVLAPRIEPLLLRNVRRSFVPQAQVEVESLLWFSPLVAARSTREILLHLGVTKALADELLANEGTEPNRLDALWAFTCRHTRHWSTEDRMERDLRYHALRSDTARVRQGVRNILRHIRAEQDEDKRIGLSRLAKRSLPVIAPHGPKTEETRWLAQYAALALGDAGAWADPGPPQALPPWLAARLPEPIGEAQLGVEIRHDKDHGQVLHLVAADSSPQTIRFSNPLPARLHVAPEGEIGAWHTVSVGARIPIEPTSPRLRLTTLEGEQWDLGTDELPGRKEGHLAQPQPTLWLIYVESDREQAAAIAAWLEKHGLNVTLVAETTRSHSIAEKSTDAQVLRLWTRGARRFWSDRTMDKTGALAGGVLLRIEDIELPTTGTTDGQVLDWRDWKRLKDSPHAERLVEGLRHWLDGGEIEPMQSDQAEEERETPDVTDEIARLIEEFQDPETEPPRRLEIGDRLAELGDPRKGVGVIEIEVPEIPDTKGPPDANEATETSPETNLTPEVKTLLEEIHNPATEPPRRLEIGDELERLGDPRRGVSLNADGLPDIDWVEIPGGSFVYQQGETRELPTFWISRYPVTNSQFQAFVDDGGYRSKGFWQKLKKPEPATSRWPQGNRPRTNIDWYEAMAFTRWLSTRLGLEESNIQLPTELEWEKVARGPKGLIYPWGEEYRSGFANVNEERTKAGPWNLKQTSAVGLYPHGHSPYGVEDLAGTVWERCLNKIDNPEITETGPSSARRVLRGGSWLHNPVFARAVNRNADRPVDRGRGIGFRLVSSVPISVR